MRGGTLFSGIGAPERAMPWVDWRWAAEIDKFASAVHVLRFPGITNLGDVTQIRPAAVELVDLVVFGSPCQSFSVAGKRLGLDDPRGNLALVALRLIARIRPRWIVFENVPGLISFDKGQDFGTFLTLLGQCGYGFAYRILDAQFAGVPQRRRRVFVVGYLGDWRPPAAVLFEPKSMRGDTPPRREAGQRIAGPIAGCAQGGSGYRNDADTAENLIAYRTSPNCGAWETGDRTDALTQGTDPTAHVVAHTLRAQPHASHRADGGRAGINVGAIALPMSVRRLTPRECERLQGFPDDWTAIQYRGKPAADGPRYRALGNSMAVPVIGWIGHRIRLFDEVTAQSSAKERAA